MEKSYEKEKHKEMWKNRIKSKEIIIEVPNEKERIVKNQTEIKEKLNCGRIKIKMKEMIVEESYEKQK